jgi:uncharacterized repeat protein (TIGR02543 family)
MNKTKQIKLLLIMVLGCISFLLDSAVGQADDLTLVQVPDLYGNFTSISNSTEALIVHNGIDIIAADSQTWALSVTVNQPKERNTAVALGASAISFNFIPELATGSLESYSKTNVLSSSARILDGKGAATIDQSKLSSSLTLGDGHSFANKSGVFLSTIIYTLVPDIEDEVTITYLNADGTQAKSPETVDKYAQVTVNEPSYNLETDAKVFIGWTEAPDQRRTEGALYRPMNSHYDTLFKSSLNMLDQAYLGGDGSGEHFTASQNKTLYATYIKLNQMGIESTKTTADLVLNPRREEFFWTSQAGIWRPIAKAGNSYLVVKASPLTTQEATGTGAADSYMTAFSTEPYYFQSDSDGLSTYPGSAVKAAIAYYYANTLADGTADQFIHPVDLDLPTYDSFKNEQNFSDCAYNQWTWPNAYTDTRFATSLTDIIDNDEFGEGQYNPYQRQAFALSTGDINSIIAAGGDETRYFIHFEKEDYLSLSEQAWLRSPGIAADRGDVDGKQHDYSQGQIALLDEHAVRPALWLSTVKQHQVDFNTTVTDNLVPSKTYDDGATLGTLPTPTRTGYYFAGWYTTPDLSDTAVTAETVVTDDTVLYAKWEDPVLEVSSIEQGSEFSFANAQWRIMKADMDTMISGNQALVVKVAALTNAEANTAGIGTATAAVRFLSGTAAGALISGQRYQYYFDSDGSNGYEDSGDGPGYGLRAAIDYYYANYIGNNENYAAYVNPVSLNNPTLANLNNSYLALHWTYDSGNEWPDFHRSSAYVTKIGGIKQAFALSNGDIVSMGLAGADSLLYFSAESYWLRSVGKTPLQAGHVAALGTLGAFDKSAKVDQSMTVHPALSLNIKQAP